MSRTSFLSFILGFLGILFISSNITLAKPKGIEYNMHLLTIYTSTALGNCSSTAIGPRAVLTAEHCYPKDIQRIFVDGAYRAVQEVLWGHNDNLIIVLKEDTFETWSKISQKIFEQGDDITFIGNPGSLRDVFRKGYIAGVYTDGILIDVNSWKGDSGSGVYDKKGYVRCTISAGFIQIDSTGIHSQFALCHMLQFKKEDLQRLGIEFI